MIVKEPNIADLMVDLDRPVFTHTFTVSSSQTSVLLMSGRVTAFDGNFASPKVAKEMLKQLGSALSLQRVEK